MADAKGPHLGQRRKLVDDLDGEQLEDHGMGLLEVS